MSYFAGPLSIPSCNLTGNIKTIGNILNSLDKTSKKYLGCISLKTFNMGDEIKYGARIVNLDNPKISKFMPGSIICRGHGEWLTIEKVSKLSQDVNKILKEKKIHSKIAISLPSFDKSSRGSYPFIISKLKEKKAEFDIVELALKYQHKIIAYKKILNLNELQNQILNEFVANFSALIWLRIALEKNDFQKKIISLKLSMDNHQPDLLATWLSKPNHPNFKILIDTAKEIILNDNNSFETAKKYGFDINQKEMNEFINKERGSEIIIIFDSEKFPTFFPNFDNYKTSLLLATEKGYPNGGGALVGKSIAKDSLKYTYLISDYFRPLGIETKIISSGGCDSGYDLATRLIFGASMVSICTVLIREPRNGFNRIVKEFIELLKKWKIKNWENLIGISLDKSTKKDDEQHYPVKLSINKNIKCACSECLAGCWYSGNYVKNSKHWPKEKECLECTSCITLCKNNKIKIK